MEGILDRRGDDLFDDDGDKIGTIEEIYLDADTDVPAWAVVQTGLLGTKRIFVPLRDATEAEGGVAVPYSKQLVKDAPEVTHDGAISKNEEAALLTHYGITSS
jgi:PRC-barrel domain